MRISDWSSDVCSSDLGASWVSIDKRVGEYMAAFLLMEVLMIGVFTAQDIFLFYIFFEAGLIPMYLIIGVWGGANRVYASYKFFKIGRASLRERVCHYV